jgi:hypothetical protein
MGVEFEINLSKLNTHTLKMFVLLENEQIQPHHTVAPFGRYPIVSNHVPPGG